MGSFLDLHVFWRHDRFIFQATARIKARGRCFSKAPLLDTLPFAIMVFCGGSCSLDIAPYIVRPASTNGDYHCDHTHFAPIVQPHWLCNWMERRSVLNREGFMIGLMLECHAHCDVSSLTHADILNALWTGSRCTTDTGRHCTISTSESWTDGTFDGEIIITDGGSLHWSGDIMIEQDAKITVEEGGTLILMRQTLSQKMQHQRSSSMMERRLQSMKTSQTQQQP